MPAPTTMPTIMATASLIERVGTGLTNPIRFAARLIPAIVGPPQLTIALARESDSHLTISIFAFVWNYPVINFRAIDLYRLIRFPIAHVKARRPPVPLSSLNSFGRSLRFTAGRR